jgi:uncharacterized protein YbjT (DUF2867 family)
MQPDHQQKRTAVILGATGLVGKALLAQLLDSGAYDVKVFVRRSTGITHPDLDEQLVRFDHLTEWSEMIRGDLLFITLGTTRRKAGSKAAQYAVDFTYPYEVAKKAAAAGVRHCVRVSSLGASARSPFFYLRIKGELEEALKGLNFPRLTILRPSLLTGEREEKRWMEEMAGVWMPRFIRVFPGLSSRRPIPGSVVARAMHKAAEDEGAGAVRVFEGEAIFHLAGDAGEK